MQPCSYPGGTKRDYFDCAKTLLSKNKTIRNVIMQNEMYGAMAVLSIFLALFVKLLIDMLGPSKPAEGKKVKKVGAVSWPVHNV